MRNLNAGPHGPEGVLGMNDNFVMKRIAGELVAIPAPRVLRKGEIADVLTVRDCDYGLVRYTNISWVLGDWHPNAGFEWNYGGAGPTDFARNILMHFTEDADFSRKFQVDFRDEFIVPMPMEGGRIRKEAIFAFIAEKRALAR